MVESYVPLITVRGPGGWPSRESLVYWALALRDPGEHTSVP